MRNEVHAFAYQPEENEPVVAPVGVAEKQSAKILEFRRPLEKKIDKDESKEKYIERNKERMLEMLENLGVIDYAGGKKIFDLEKFLDKDFFENEFRNKTFTIEKGKKRSITKAMLFDALRDIQVVSRKEYVDSLEDGIDTSAKSLFNIPESAAEAFDVEKIKTKKYYLNYWDIFGSAGERQVNWKHDMISKKGEKIDMREFAFATRLFKEFKAHRNLNDQMKVFDSNKDSFVNISVEWIHDNIGSSHELEKSVHAFLLNNCPHLLNNRILKLSDFQTKTESSGGKLLRAEKFVSKDKPEVSLNGAKYYIGRENFIFNGKETPTEDIKIVLLDSKTAGVVLLNSGEEDVICLIDLLDEDEKVKKRDYIQKGSTKQLEESEITARTFLNKKEMAGRIKDWDCTKENPRFEGEEDTQYALRMRSIARYKYIKKVTDDFALQTGIGIHNLSWREQQWLVSAAFDLKNDYPQLLEFGKIYGIDGLKTFLSCEYGLEHGKEILRIGEKLSPETASAIFAKYNEIASTAENNIQDLINNYLGNIEGTDKEQHQKTSESLLKKSKDLLLGFSEKLKTNKKVDEQALLQELEKSKIDTVFLTSILKTFAKENSDILFEDFKGLSFDTSTGKGIENEKDISQMVSIAQKNYATNVEMQKLVIESLQEGLQKENSQFYILRHNGEIVAFCRFDDEGDHFYAGSFNVDPDYRGSAIGEVMMRESLDKKAQEKPVHAITDPKKVICSKYIEDEGFIIDEILYTEIEGKTLEEVNIVRDDEKNKAYEYRVRYRPEDIALAYNKQQLEIKSGNKSRSETLKNRQSFIALFDKEQETERFLKLSEKLMKEYGYVITRFLQANKEGKKCLQHLSKNSRS